MRVFNGIDEVASAVGTHLGTGAWRAVTRQQVDLFADATDDHQWIHVDPVRAAAGPFGGPIAHGFLTLSLLTALVHGIYRVDGLSMAVNYGLNKVRFPAPVLVGSRVRAAVDLVALDRGAKGAQSTSRVTVEIEESTKPACVAEWIGLLVP